MHPGQLGLFGGRPLRSPPSNGHHQELSQVRLERHGTVFRIQKNLFSRELPEPLMGGDLYQDWLEAGSLVFDLSLYFYLLNENGQITTPQEGDDKFDAVWNLLQHEPLPRENYKNIQYLFKVLPLV